MRVLVLNYDGVGDSDVGVSQEGAGVRERGGGCRRVQCNVSVGGRVADEGPEVADAGQWVRLPRVVCADRNDRTAGG